MNGPLPLEWQLNAIDRLSRRMSNNASSTTTPLRHVSAASKGNRHGRR